MMMRAMTKRRCHADDLCTPKTSIYHCLRSSFSTVVHKITYRISVLKGFLLIVDEKNRPNCAEGLNFGKRRVSVQRIKTPRVSSGSLRRGLLSYRQIMEQFIRWYSSICNQQSGQPKGPSGFLTLARNIFLQGSRMEPASKFTPVKNSELSKILLPSAGTSFVKDGHCVSGKKQANEESYLGLLVARVISPDSHKDGMLCGPS